MAADAPALRELRLVSVALYDAGPAPLVGALSCNTHLEALDLTGTGMSEAFARDTLLPALRDNAALQYFECAVHVAQDLVNRRRQPRFDWLRGERDLVWGQRAAVDVLNEQPPQS